MKEVAKNYFKTVLIVFAILFVFYTAFELLIIKSPFDLFGSFSKVLLLAVLLPLFSRKYLAQVSAPDDLAKFTRNRRYLYYFIGGLIALSVILAVIFYFTNQSTNR